MSRSAWIFSLFLMSTLAAFGGSPAESTPLLLISEVRPGSMASDQRCTLIFPDHHYHHEVASRKHGRDMERKVYEGALSPSDWNSLTEIIDSKDFRDLDVPRTVPSLVMQDVHSYTISVNREGKFQNMEFLTNKSRKPYESQLKPLLQWWKSFYDQHLSPSTAAPDSKCSLDNNSAVFAQ